MKITRRNFVQTLGTATAVTVSVGGLHDVLGKASANAGELSASTRTLFSMKPAQVKSLIGRVFTATSSNGQTKKLVLSEVNGVGRRLNAKRGYSGECFSVIFKDSGEGRLGQDVYKMRSASTDEFTALLVPTGRRSKEYEIIVNRLKR